MTTTSRCATIAVLLIAACNNGNESTNATAAKPVEKTAAPMDCGGPELAELSKQLETASGIGVDMSQETGSATVNAAISRINGKHFAFKNCVFRSQGNDEVQFASPKDPELYITCKVAGGDAGHREFRHTAVKFDRDKLRLDINGIAGSNDDPNFERYVLKECRITPHD